MNIINLKNKRTVVTEILLFHRCPTILDGLAHEFVAFVLLGMCDFSS